jgi:hypothetical protein
MKQRLCLVSQNFKSFVILVNSGLKENPLITFAEVVLNPNWLSSLCLGRTIRKKK